MCIHIRIAPGGSPQIIDADSLALGTINILWDPPIAELRYGIITEYQIIYGIDGSNITNTISTVYLNITLTGLLDNTTYRIGIAAINEAGVSPFGFILSSTIAPRNLLCL